MYRIEDRAGAIKELQRLLNLNQTGVYDNETRDAVLDVQESHALTQTGIADYETFTAIVREYQQIKSEKWNSDYLFNPIFPYTKGDFDDNVEKINDAIALVLIDYVYEGIVPRGKYFGDDTINGVNYLRSIFLMKESDEVDEAFMTRIMLERDVIEAKRKHT